MNPSSEREAMPCPFCGGEPMSNPVESMFHTFRIVCPHCEMCGPERMTASEAIAAWQGRTAISTQPQQAGWMPIDTAPKGSGPDGPSMTTHPDYIEPPKILLATAEGIVVGYYDWYYHEGYGRGAEPGVSAWRDHDGAQTYGATHWMPLPNHPQELT